MEDALLSVENLKTYFFTTTSTIRAVDDISLQVNKQETVGLIGESGCGKSTAAFSIMRLIPTPPGKILGGKISFNGEDILQLPDNEMRKVRGNKISMIFQDPMTFLNPVFKIGNQIAETIMLHQNTTKKEAHAKAIQVLNEVQIPTPKRLLSSYPFQLSGGMRQRVVISIAISCNPSLLIADEPTTALDVTIQAQILELLKELKETRNMAILLITHDLGLVAEICDRVYVMYAGKIVEHSNVFSIFEKPLHPYTKGLLESALSIEEFKKDLVTIEGIVPNLGNPPSGCRFHPRCSEVMSLCKNQEPPLIEVEPGHFVVCWLYK